MSGENISTRMLKFADAQCLPLGLVSAVLMGIAIPWVGYSIGTGGYMSIFCVVCLFFIAGLKLKHEEAKAALKAYKATSAGLASILCITCSISSGLTMALPMQNDDFKLGMIIFFCMPCTINSGAVLAKQAGGNFAMALLLTVAGNLLGIFTCPVLLYLFADLKDTSFPLGSLLGKLVGTVFVPMMCGKACLSIPWNDHAIRKGVATYNKRITLLSNGLLICIPWMKISQSMQNGDLAEVSLGDAIAVLMWTMLMHILFLGINYGLGVVLKLELDMLKALVMVGSSKTLPMALSVLTFLPPQVANNGIIAVPMMIAHIGQIVMDGFLAASWAQRTARQQEMAQDIPLEAVVPDVDEFEPPTSPSGAQAGAGAAPRDDLAAAAEKRAAQQAARGTTRAAAAAASGPPALPGEQGAQGDEALANKTVGGTMDFSKV